MVVMVQYANVSVVTVTVMVRYADVSVVMVMGMVRYADATVVTVRYANVGAGTVVCGCYLDVSVHVWAA